MNSALLRVFWQRLFRRAWIVSLVLFVAFRGVTVFGIGWAFYGRTADNWYVSVLDSFSIGAPQMQIPRFLLFVLYTLPAVIFSPIEEFFFRGMIHEAVKEQWGATVATPVNALTFGGIHLLHHGLRWTTRVVTFC